MKNFISLLILVILLSFFITTNSSPVSIYIGPYIFNVPFSIALILPLCIGLLIFTVVYLAKVRRIESVIKHNENEINDLQNSITQLNKQVHQLKIENNKLKTRLGDKSFDDESI